MEINEYLDDKKELQKSLIDYFDNIDNEDEKFYDCMEIINLQKTLQDRQDFKDYLNLLLNITNNYHRPPNIYKKIGRILSNFKKEFHDFFTKVEIFNIFKSSKLILLYLIEQGYLEVDEYFFHKISSEKYRKKDYLSYFYYEIEKYLDSLKQEIEKKFSEQNIEFSAEEFNSFNEKRKIGENDSEICKLIRNDSVIEFISYINKNNISLASTIEPSIFETNIFLINKKTTLIEYAAFFGSIQILKYIQLNHVNLTQSLWLYSIHGHNSEIIHLLEENHVSPKDGSFEECLIESIKCHFVELTNYLSENLIDKNDDEKELIFSNESLKYSNYICFPSNFNKDVDLFNLVQYNYNAIVEFILGTSEMNVNTLIISLKNFLQNSKKIKNFIEFQVLFHSISNKIYFNYIS